MVTACTHTTTEHVMENGSQLHICFALGTICTQRHQLDMCTTGEKLQKLQENTTMHRIRILCTPRLMVPVIKSGIS